MPDLTTLRSLLARVREVEGPSFELDVQIGVALAGGGFREGKNIHWGMLAQGYGVGQPLTSSIDAAVALVERVLPPIRAYTAGSQPSSGWKINLYRGMTPTGQRFASWQVNIREHASEGFDGQAATLPLAILDSLLQALIACAEAEMMEDVG